MSCSQDGFLFKLNSLPVFAQQMLSKLSGTWNFLSLEISKHAKALRIAQTPLPFLISGLNKWLFEPGKCTGSRK
ncbi:hypothetical protein GmHk_06G016863 [Glycine max]|nr:hypothetical protein GmHk_06G016863 [Glycine max]